MRFMMLVIPKGYEKAPAGFAPPAELVAKMTKYNEPLTKAGVVLALDGLHPPSTGARVRFAGGKATATDGPFTAAKEVPGGYWMSQGKSAAKAVGIAGPVVALVVPADDGLDIPGELDLREQLDTPDRMHLDHLELVARQRAGLAENLVRNADFPKIVEIGA